MIPSAQCTLNVSFEPTQTGPLPAPFTIKVNALNATGAIQSIPLSETGIAP
jgi:hypothetical protein